MKDEVSGCKVLGFHQFKSSPYNGYPQISHITQNKREETVFSKYMKEAFSSQINILVIQPFLKISSLHSVHKAFPCRTVPRLCCFQGQISASLPALHYLPASAAITTNNHSTQGISPVSPNRNSCGEKTKTHSVQAPWQRKAGSLGTAISSSDKWSQQHTGLSLVLPASLVNLPAENTSLTVTLRRGQWISGLGLSYCPGSRHKAGWDPWVWSQIPQ